MTVSPPDLVSGIGVTARVADDAVAGGALVMRSRCYVVDGFDAEGIPPKEFPDAARRVCVAASKDSWMQLGSVGLICYGGGERSAVDCDDRTAFTAVDEGAGEPISTKPAEPLIRVGE
ncbi:MAG: hypothetical protein JRN21_05515 [Nitrososphaerota archaeon]|nr:hypothetical protein [Nitrososphaerota archaeon]